MTKRKNPNLYKHARIRQLMNPLVKLKGGFHLDKRKQRAKLQARNPISKEEFD